MKKNFRHLAFILILVTHTALAEFPEPKCLSIVDSVLTKNGLGTFNKPTHNKQPQNDLTYHFTGKKTAVEVGTKPSGNNTIRIADKNGKVALFTIIYDTETCKIEGFQCFAKESGEGFSLMGNYEACQQHYKNPTAPVIVSAQTDQNSKIKENQEIDASNPCGNKLVAVCDDYKSFISSGPTPQNPVSGGQNSPDRGAQTSPKAY